MSEVCCVNGCPSGRTATESTVTFHRFPPSEENRTLWAAALWGGAIWEPSETDVVCSLHFERNDFVLNELGEAVELSAEAVPSIQLQGSQEVILEAENQSENATLEEKLKQSDDVDDSNDKPDEVKYAHLVKRIQLDKNAPRDELLQYFNGAFRERFLLKKKMKSIRQKHTRIIQKMTRACEKKGSQNIDETVLEPDAKKRKKGETCSKLYPVNLEEVLTYLETQELLSCQAISVIKSLLSHSLTTVIEHDHRASFSKDTEITPVMKIFAKTVLFYSAEAYLTMKESFELPIPPPSVTRTWYNMGIGLPGWSSEAFLMLKDEIQKCEGIVLNTCVVMGEYDLHSASSYDDTEVRGHIDYGTTGDLEMYNYSENLPLARSALYFMLVPVNSKRKWKIPLAYFLIDTLSPEERANILMECLWRIYNMGSVAVAVVLDASVNSRRTVESLGISFEDLPYPSTSFPHPADGLLDVHVLFDPYHILDLLRHTWASIALMVDEKGGAISWKYFTELVKVQETQAGSSEQVDQIATWYWDKNLMRKRLISQLFTEDVANAIECCSSSLMLPQFAGCESTVLFIRTINKIIDIFHPKNSLIRSGKTSEWKKTIVDALNYLFVLRDRTGQGIFATNCKAPFVCLYMNLISLLELSKKVSLSSFSQLNLNGLDMLFVGIRSRLNWEDCPSASKFINAYSLLLQEEGFTFTENIVKVDNFWWLDGQDVSNVRQCGLTISRPVLKTENTLPLPRYFTFYPVLLQNELQRFRASQLVLVHTVKRVADVLHCNFCIEGLQMQYVQDNPTLVLLRKTCGGFVYPSQGVVEVCALSERHLRTELKTAPFEMKHDVYTRRDCALIQTVCLAVMSSVLDRHRNPFPQLDEHLRECPEGSDHVYRLIRLLTTSFVLLRLQSLRAWNTSLH